MIKKKIDLLFRRIDIYPIKEYNKFIYLLYQTILANLANITALIAVGLVGSSHVAESDSGMKLLI